MSVCEREVSCYVCTEERRTRALLSLISLFTHTSETQCMSNIYAFYEQGGAKHVAMYPHSFIPHRESRHTHTQAKGWQHSTIAWWNGFSLMKGLLLNSSLLDCFWGSDSTLPSARTPHLGAISRLNMRLLYTPTLNAWGLAGKSLA